MNVNKFRIRYFQMRWRNSLDIGLWAFAYITLSILATNIMNQIEYAHCLNMHIVYVCGIQTFKKKMSFVERVKQRINSWVARFSSIVSFLANNFNKSFTLCFIKFFFFFPQMTLTRSQRIQLIIQFIGTYCRFACGPLMLVVHHF